MGLVLDEQNDKDKIIEKDGLTFVVGEDLAQFSGFEISYSNSFLRKGFTVNIMGYSGGSC
jgi:Fe-S cluster assembly iron-binding protein IscA